MKVMILTHSLGKNYGGIMQAYALQSYLKSRGHDPVTIDRRAEKKGAIYKLALFLYRFIKYRLGKRSVPPSINGSNDYILTQTREFISNNMNMSPPINSSSELRQFFVGGGFEAIVVGSDQVWRPKYVNNIYDYYLKFAYDFNLIKISYAASFGVDVWEYKRAQTIKCAALLEKFHSVSVREQSAVSLCDEYLNRKAKLVLDPTLLFDRDFYEKEMGLARTALSVTSYWLDEDHKKKNLVRDACEALGLGEKRLLSFNNIGSDCGKSCLPRPEDWLNGFYNAELVVTDSFHGIVFAVIFGKEFLVIANKERGRARMVSLLSILGLENRLFDSCESALGFLDGYDNINYKDVYERLNFLRSESEKFLDDSLGIPGAAMHEKVKG